MPALTLSLPLFLRVGGVVLGGASLGFLIWVHQALGIDFTTSVFVRPHHRFIRRGPYGLVRHPMYAAYFMLFFAAFLISESWVFGISGMGIIGMLMTLRLKREEKNLIARFGAEYRHSRENTSRFFPFPLVIQRIRQILIRSIRAKQKTSSGSRESLRRGMFP